MRAIPLKLAFLMLACADNGEPAPAPGEPCTPRTTVMGACYDAANLGYCEKQGDGSFRWSAPMACNTSVFPAPRMVTHASCGCLTPPGATAAYPNVTGACNCWGTGGR
jgi:hypothetical protein